MSWGTELWDKYEDLCRYSVSGIDFLENSVADFIKERGKVEKEYAKSLRALVKKYTPKNSEVKDRHSKDGPQSLRLEDEKYTHLEAYKEMLKEVGFQAGQHEVLAESFSKEISKGIQEQSKQLREVRRKNMKESEKLVNELNSAYKAMQSSKEKFRKSYEDQEKASGLYNKADADGNVSRNEIEKLRSSAQNKTAVCDSMKHTFADQLVKTNAFRQRYYYELLPGVLDELQDLEHKRIELIRHGMLSCIAKERQVAPIIAKCHDSISVAMNNIQPEKDSAIVIEKFKSGDVPPGDFNFEDMQDPHSMLTADALANTGPSNLNLYPRKKELERQMARIEAELSKSQKELFSLNQMMETYQNNPKFGNSKKFQSEIQNLHSHVSELESALTSIRAEHVQVEERLGALRARTSSPNIRLSPTARLQRGGSSNSSGSMKSSTLSIASSSNNRVYDVPSIRHSSDEYDEIPAPPPCPPMPDPPSSTHSDTMSSMSSPSVSSNSSTDGHGLKRCVALYTYANQNMEESNIPMEEGEEFWIVDEDCDGWTRVRRCCANPDYGDEGFVPTTWIRLI